MEKLDEVRSILLSLVAETAEPRSVLRSAELRELYGVIATLPIEERGAFGKKVNLIFKFSDDLGWVRVW